MSGAGGPGKAKILVVGPTEVGKTTIANYLAEHTTGLTQPAKYKPTQALRVLEFDREVPAGDAGRGSGSLSVELWDVSGDQKFEGCWPAIIKGAVGVVLVYNPEKKEHEHMAALWYEWFVQNPGLDDRQCLVFAHRATSGPRPRPREYSQRTHAFSPAPCQGCFTLLVAAVAESSAMRVP